MVGKTSIWYEARQWSKGVGGSLSEKDHFVSYKDFHVRLTMEL